MNAQTSARAKWCLCIVVAGYFAIAVVAGAPASPLTVPLPAGTRPPSWATGLASVVGLHRLGRDGLIGVAWILVVVVLAAFAVVLREAFAKRVRLAAILVAAGISLALSVAAPLLLSRDVYTYAAYGRIEALRHVNPYVVSLSSFPHDPFVALTPGQWVHTHSHYGPVFTLASAVIARTWPGSPGATIFAFKLLAGLAIAAATVFAALAARRARPDRAPLAAALVGLNPVLVLHTVGGGHVDALIAAPIAVALAIAVTGPPPRSARALAITLLLTIACLVKTVIVPVLVIWMWWLVRSARDRRGRILGEHLGIVAALTLASAAPFVAGWHTLTPFVTLGGVEAWASPSHLVGRGAQAVAGSEAARAVEVAFLLFFAVLVQRLVRRVPSLQSVTAAGTWGAALLLLALSMPYLLPWYAAWFAPCLCLVDDNAFLFAGALVTGVLAVTLIPADPFHGLTTPAVMNGVHYGAASVLLLVLAVLAARILSPAAREHVGASGTERRDTRQRTAVLPQ